MKINSINLAYGAALRFACTRNKRGFQTEVARLVGIDRGNFNNIMKGAGASEEKRRSILATVLDLDTTFPAKTYDDFLSLGQWLLDHDNDPSGWQVGQRIDKVILAESISIVEELIIESKIVLPTAKKVEMIIAMYENITSEYNLKKEGKNSSLVSTLKLFIKNLL